MWAMSKLETCFKLLNVFRNERKILNFFFLVCAWIWNMNNMLSCFLSIWFFLNYITISYEIIYPIIARHNRFILKTFYMHYLMQKCIRIAVTQRIRISNKWSIRRTNTTKPKYRTFQGFLLSFSLIYTYNSSIQEAFVSLF